MIEVDGRILITETKEVYMGKMHDKIKEDIKQAMKEHDAVKRDCLKNVIGKAQAFQKGNGSSVDNIEDSVIIDSLYKEAKQLNQTINALQNIKDSELFETSVKQLEILDAYIPKQMTREEIEKEVAWILSDNKYGSFGEKMKVVMKELKGKADGKLIKEVVEGYK